MESVLPISFCTACVKISVTSSSPSPGDNKEMFELLNEKENEALQLTCIRV
jgi:hypothetical protein